MKRLRRQALRNSLRCSSVLRSERSKRRGVGTIELLLALPVLLIGSLATFEFGILMLVEHAVSTAAIEGAREAGKGANCDEVTAIVDEYLSAHHLTVEAAGAVRVVCESRISGVTTTVERGNPTIACTTSGSALNDGEVRITVCVQATDGLAPVPDWLTSIGFSLDDQTLMASSLANFE